MDKVDQIIPYRYEVQSTWHAKQFIRNTHEGGVKNIDAVSLCPLQCVW